MEGTERVLGKVKWFNYQNGYGFITPLNATEGDQDVFVHHTSINVKGNQYRYLVEGEYVEYTLENVNSREHSFHAVDITGINRNMLMCETRNNATRLKPFAPQRENSPISRQNSPFPPKLQRTTTTTDGFEFPKQKHQKR